MPCKIAFLVAASLFLASFDAYGQNSCSIQFLLRNRQDTPLLKNVARNDDCLTGFLDSASTYLSRHLDRAGDVYWLLDRLAQYSDGGPAEVIALGSYDVFIQKPVPMLQYMSRHKKSSLERNVLNELCMSVGKQERFATKSDAVKFLRSCKKGWKAGSSFIDGLITRFDGLCLP